MDFQGMVVFGLSLVMIFYAVPKQILKNYREGKCSFELAIILLPLAIYMARAIFAFNKGFVGAWFLYVPDAVGALVMMGLLLQYLGYFIGGERK
ncbi:MAG: hypothetical protein Q7S12_02550 [bacterium]|nr:hypothetical protein [bacterium]